MKPASKSGAEGKADASPAPSKTMPPAPAATAAFSNRHLRIGWWSLLGFLALGMILESLHGFKVGWYLNVSNETRRLMWTLAHAHGTLFGLLQVAFGLTTRALPLWEPRQRSIAGAALTGATVLLPGGFLLGGGFVHGGDPGLGIVLVPLGAALAFLGVGLTARAITRGSGAG